MPYLERGLATSAAAPWALTSARPVVGTRIPALVEIQDDAACLRLVSPHASRELAAAILEVDNNEELAKTLVSNAEVYCERTAWPVIAQRHLDVYEAVIAEGSPAG